MADLRAQHLPALRKRGPPVLPHAVSLSPDGAEPLDTNRVEHLAELARVLGASPASDHVCFGRAGGLDSGHLMPLPRTREALNVLVANARARPVHCGRTVGLSRTSPPVTA